MINLMSELRQPELNILVVTHISKTENQFFYVSISCLFTLYIKNYVPLLFLKISYEIIFFSFSKTAFNYLIYNVKFFRLNFLCLLCMIFRDYICSCINAYLFQLLRSTKYFVSRL